MIQKAKAITGDISELLARQWVLILVPLALIASMYVTFKYTRRSFKHLPFHKINRALTDSDCRRQKGIAVQTFRILSEPSC